MNTFRWMMAGSAAPGWGLAAAYWLHMLATVTWIGGLAALALFVLPAARRSLPAGSYATLLEQIQRRLDPLAWLSLIVLAGTGLFQMSANPNYQGLLTIDNGWTAAIFAKHLVFLALVASSTALTWGVLPALRRAAWQQSRGAAAAEALERLGRREARLLQLNLALGIVILGLTAIARIS